MAYTVACPTCGASSTVRSHFALMAVCESCRGTLWLTEKTAEAGPKMPQLTPPLSGLFVGAEGKLEGKPFFVAGRVRYRYGEGFWDEWFLSTPDSPAWLSEDEGELTLEQPALLDDAPPSFGRVALGSSLRLADRPFRVEEKDTAVCDGGEGELPFKIVPGEKLPYLEGVTGLGMGTLEYGEGGASFFLGKRVPLAALSLEEASLAKAQASRAAPRKAGAFPCPACGGSLALRSGKEAEAIVCEYCDTLVDLSEGKHKALAKVLKAGPTLEGLRVGLKGTLRGAEWEVVGRLRYRDVTPSDW